MSGLPATGSISLGTALVAGSILVPKPAAGITAFVIFWRSNILSVRLEEKRESPGRQESRCAIRQQFAALSSAAERIPTSSQQLSILDVKPRDAKSSLETIRCG